MIKNTDLRLGNLLLCGSTVQRVTALATDKVNSSPINTEMPGNSSGIYEYLPLDEEWMNRFAGNDSGYITISELERTTESSDLIILSTVECYLHEDGFLRVCAYEYDKQPDGSLNISDDVITLGYRHIQYAHQLQNLYFDLSGKELTF
jgi:hypothetical protein